VIPDIPDMRTRTKEETTMPIFHVHDFMMVLGILKHCQDVRNCTGVSDGVGYTEHTSPENVVDGEGIGGPKAFLLL